MKFEELRSKIIIKDGDFSLSPGVLTTEVDEWLRKYFPSGPLLVKCASKTEETNKVIVCGMTNALSSSPTPSKADVTFSLDDKENVRILLRVTFDPNNWSFPQSFPDNRIIASPASLVADVKFSECCLLLSNQVVLDYPGFSLYEGFNFYGLISEWSLRDLFAIPSDFNPVMHGHITFDDDKKMPELSFGEAPFHLDTPLNPLPGFVFSIDLEDFGRLEIKDIFVLDKLIMKMYMPPSGAFAKNNSSYHLFAGFYGTMFVPSLNLTTCSGFVNFVPPWLEFNINKTEMEAPMESLANMSLLWGGRDVMSALPNLLNKDELSNPALHSLNINFDMCDGTPRFSSMLATVKLPDATLSLLDDKVKVQDIRIEFTFSDDRDDYHFNEDDKFKLELYGMAVVDEQKYALTSFDNPLVLRLHSLEPSVDRPLPVFIKSFCPAVPVLRDDFIVHGNRTCFEISPSGKVEIQCYMEGKMTVPVGKSTLDLTADLLSVSYKGDSSKCKGFYSLNADLFGDRVGAEFVIPGLSTSFLIIAQRNVSVSSMIDKFCSEKVAFPSGFDVFFCNASLLFEKAEDKYKLRALSDCTGFSGEGNLLFLPRDEADKKKRFEFEMLEKESGIGFVFGLEIFKDEYWNAPGLSNLEVFKPFKLTDVVLTVSTVEDKSYTFPARNTFTSTFPGIDEPQISTALPGVLKGFNLVSKWELDTTSKKQALLKDLLSLPAVIPAVMPVEPSAPPKLCANCEATVRGHPRGIEFGAILKDDKVLFYAKSGFQVMIKPSGTPEISFGPLGSAQGAAGQLTVLLTALTDATMSCSLSLALCDGVYDVGTVDIDAGSAKTVDQVAEALLKKISEALAAVAADPAKLQALNPCVIH